ncbi:hypothetical protein AVEN_68003-1 [Araneus ventricosus]|uniref:Uncharacterized protein n=1 Tax=Araneus ventricosus TaxID=182803 RepID=A0A4Y2TT54_ARAVE|nr:hypothetical protein AVEN_68003-1 [Araneus ventricosus]
MVGPKRCGTPTGFETILILDIIDKNFGQGEHKIKPAGVVSPKLSRILLEKGAVSPPPAWIKKIEPIVTQVPMTIRKYLGKRLFLLALVPVLLLLPISLTALAPPRGSCGVGRAKDLWSYWSDMVSWTWSNLGPRGHETTTTTTFQYREELNKGGLQARYATDDSAAV